MELLQERYIKDREAGTDSEPEGHGHEAKAHDDPAVIKPCNFRVCFKVTQ
jgi:hypothetical protein